MEKIKVVDLHNYEEKFSKMRWYSGIARRKNTNISFILKENVIVSYYYTWYFFKNILFSLNKERKLKLVSTIKIIKQRN